MSTFSPSVGKKVVNDSEINRNMRVQVDNSGMVSTLGSLGYNMETKEVHQLLSIISPSQVEAEEKLSQGSLVEEKKAVISSKRKSRNLIIASDIKKQKSLSKTAKSLTDDNFHGEFGDEFIDLSNFKQTKKLKSADQGGKSFLESGSLLKSKVGNTSSRTAHTEFATASLNKDSDEPEKNPVIIADVVLQPDHSCGKVSNLKGITKISALPELKSNKRLSIDISSCNISSFALSGFHSNEKNSAIELLCNLGCRVCEDESEFRNVQCLIVADFKRTVKIFLAIIHKIPIVFKSYIDAVSKESRVINISEYLCSNLFSEDLIVKSSIFWSSDLLPVTIPEWKNLIPTSRLFSGWNFVGLFAEAKKKSFKQMIEDGGGSVLILEESLQPKISDWKTVFPHMVLFDPKIIELALKNEELQAVINMYHEFYSPLGISCYEADIITDYILYCVFSLCFFEIIL